MRLPFVSRLLLEDARADRLLFARRYDELLTRYTDLVRDMLAMRREGFTSPPVMDAVPEPTPLPLRIEAVLDDLNLSARDRAREEALIRSWQADGVTDDDLLTRFLDGTRG